MIFNVRCCCNPNIVLGTLDVPNASMMSTHIDVPRLVPVRAWSRITQPEQAESHVTHDRLEIGDVWLDGAYLERAIKSNDRPIEFWRQLRGFHEYPR